MSRFGDRSTSLDTVVRGHRGWVRDHRVHVRQAQVDDVIDDTKSEDSERIITLDKARAESLRAWRKTQLAERLGWGAEWVTPGRALRLTG